MRTEEGFYLYTSIKELENDKNKFTKFNKPDYDGFVSVDFDSLYEHKIAGRSDFKPLKEIESKVDVVQYRSDFYENTELCFTDVSQVMEDIPDELKNEKVNFYIKSLSHFKSGSGPGEIYNFDRYLNVVLYLDENSLNNFLNILTSNYYKYFTVFFSFSKFHDCTEGNYRITSYDLKFKKGK